MRVPEGGRGRSWAGGHGLSRPVLQGPRGARLEAPSRVGLPGSLLRAPAPRRVSSRLPPWSWMRAGRCAPARGICALSPAPTEQRRVLPGGRGGHCPGHAPPKRIVGAGSPAGSGLGAPRGRSVPGRRETVSAARAPGPRLPRSRSRGGRRGGRRIRRPSPARVGDPRGALERRAHLGSEREGHGALRPGKTLLQRVTFLHGPRPREQTRQRFK